MRHGRKTTSSKTDGYKGHIKSGGKDNKIITAVEVTAANVPDSEPIPDQIEQRKENTGKNPDTLSGDTAYGGAETRKYMEEEEIELIAKVPPAINKNGCFNKDKFVIDLDNKYIEFAGVRLEINKELGEKEVCCKFPKEQCQNCPLKDQCTKSKDGRTVRIHPHEVILQKARKQQQTEEFKETYRFRSRVERIIYCVTKNGGRKGRYKGHEKNRFKSQLHAAINNIKVIHTVAEKNPVSVVQGEVRPFIRKLRYIPMLVIYIVKLPYQY